jgi:FG-GAP repeat
MRQRFSRRTSLISRNRARKCLTSYLVLAVAGASAVASIAYGVVGDLYEADFGSGNVFKFTPAGARTTFATVLSSPAGLAFDSEGNLFVSNFTAARIDKITPNRARMAASGSNANLQRQDNTASASPAFEAGATTHETRIELQTAGAPTATEAPAKGEIEIPAPTRSSFMVTWPGVTGARGYLLDVSTNPSFSSYLDAYHDLDVGNVTGRTVTALSPGTTYYYRVRPYDADGPGRHSATMIVTTVATTGLIINATFGSSITHHPNAVAIEAMIDRCISLYESLFTDPITIQILFRYATTAPDGHPLRPGATARSDSGVYHIPWSTYLAALRADAKTSNDNLANASLPTSALSTIVRPSSADGRAVGLDTPPGMFANGTVGNGGPYDGIVTLNSSAPFRFARPVDANNFDAQRETEHEIDEVMGLGSAANISFFHPQDLFTWSSAGVRNITSNGTRYFSINGGVTKIVDLNQSAGMDFGDWLSTLCPQTHPYVQNASDCPGQSSDIAATSPEGVSLDVIGYDLASGAPTPTPTPSAATAVVADFNGDGHPDWVVRNPTTRLTAIWYLDNNVLIGGDVGPTLAAGWGLRGMGDFNGDNHSDYALFFPSTDQTAIWYLSGPTFIGGAYGPTLPNGWELVGVADFNADSKPDYVLYKASTHQTAIWYLNNNVLVGGDVGPTLPSGWALMGVADFDGDGHLDYGLFNSTTRQTAIWYLSGPTLIGGVLGPTLPSGWALVATADFNGDGKPDFVLYNAGTHQTAIWYLNNNVFVSGAFGPTLPAGWSLVAP